MHSLTELDLSRNALTGHLAHEIGQLGKLKLLLLRENKLLALPGGLGGCTALVELHAGPPLAHGCLCPQLGL